MSTPTPDDPPKPEPPPPPIEPAPPVPLPPPAEAPPPQPEAKPKSRWKRYTLPLDRKERPVSAPQEPTGPPPKSNTLRTVLIILGVLVGLPIAGCLFLWVLCAVGLR